MSWYSVSNVSVLLDTKMYGLNDFFSALFILISFILLWMTFKPFIMKTILRYKNNTTTEEDINNDEENIRSNESSLTPITYITTGDTNS